MRWLSLGRVWQRERKALIYDARKCSYDGAFRELAQNQSVLNDAVIRSEGLSDIGRKAVNAQLETLTKDMGGWPTG